LVRAFAEDCISGIGAASTQLPAGALRKAATELGFGEPDSLGAPSFGGVVPEGSSALRRVQNAVGEGDILVSPLAMARAAATIATGHYQPSVLVTDPPAAAAPAGPQLSDSQRLTLQQWMRQSVLTDPQQVSLRGAATEPVAAIAGSAGYGPAADAAKYAWCTGYRGTVAFAVLVTGTADAAAAARVAATFLS
jgi:cell division protein FtsI/penicillin-binding protein 2